MIKTNPLSVKDIEQIAVKTRNHFNVSLDDAFPIIDIVEDLACKEVFNYIICEDEELKDAYAKYDVKTNTIIIKESTYNECLDGVYRSNFTIAHEFFHFIQAKILKFDFEEVEKCASYTEIEWQANEFAAQLLIPTKALNLDIQEIINRYKVSEEFVLYRKLKYKKRNRKKDK